MPQGKAEERYFKARSMMYFGAALLAGRIAQAIAFFVMARMLGPSMMGVVAILTVTYVGLFQLTNLGFDRYIVYARDNAPADWRRTVDAVWTLQMVRGLLVVMAAPPTAWLITRLSDSQSNYIQVIGIALSIAILSFTNPELSSFERSGDFSIIANARALSVLTGSVVTIGLVVALQDPIAYVAGQIATGIVLVSFSFVAVPRVPTICWDVEKISELFAYSKHLLVIAIVSFLSAQFQNIYIGWAFGPAVLGFYFIWLRLATLPRDFMNQLLDRIVFAKVSDSMRRNDAMDRVHLVSFAGASLALGPFFVFVWFDGGQLISFLASAKWVPYWWVGKYFILISACSAISLTIGPFMLVTNAHLSSRLRSAEVTVEIILMLALGHFYGVAGVLVALLVGASSAMLARLFLLFKLIVREHRLAHARAMALCLALALGGPMVWQAIVRPILPQEIAFLATATAYAVYTLGISVIMFQRRERIMKGVCN